MLATMAATTLALYVAPVAVVGTIVDLLRNSPLLIPGVAIAVIAAVFLAPASGGANGSVSAPRRPARVRLRGDPGHHVDARQWRRLLRPVVVWRPAPAAAPRATALDLERARPQRRAVRATRRPHRADPAGSAAGVGRPRRGGDAHRHRVDPVQRPALDRICQTWDALENLIGLAIGHRCRRGHRVRSSVVRRTE